MPGHDIIVVGASAGGVESLSELVGGLPAGLPASLFVVLHVPAHGVSLLPQILSRAGPLPAFHPVDGQLIEAGRIYVAPPDHHLLVEPGAIRLSRGSCENSHRPAADPLFRAAARSYGPRVVGVILSGILDDGTAGLAAIKARHGVAMVQDPKEASYPGMAQSALDNVAVDYCLLLRDIASTLTRLSHEAVVQEPAPPVAADLDKESGLARLNLVQSGLGPKTLPTSGRD